MGTPGLVSHARYPAERQCTGEFRSTSVPRPLTTPYMQAPASQSLSVFTSVVVIIALGSLVVTVQAKVRLGNLRWMCFSNAFPTASRRSRVRPNCHKSVECGDLRNISRSFFQGLCVLGYCVAPLNVAALVSTFVHLIYVRAPVALAAWAWCIWGTSWPQGNLSPLHLTTLM